jgi:hypothetical protein
MKSLKRLFLTVLTVCIASIPVIAQSSLISCVLEDLDDSQGTGGDLWQATYTLGDLNWQNNWVDYGNTIAIRFLSSAYQSIEWVDDDINIFWMAGTGPSNSFDQELTFTASMFHSPSEDIGSDFSIKYIWTGLDDPGDHQMWGLYRSEMNYNFGLFDTMGMVNIDEIKHLEANVPEPSTILLFGVGLAGIASIRRRVRNS